MDFSFFMSVPEAPDDDADEKAEDDDELDHFVVDDEEVVPADEADDPGVPSLLKLSGPHTDSTS